MAAGEWLLGRVSEEEPHARLVNNPTTHSKRLTVQATPGFGYFNYQVLFAAYSQI